MVLGDFNVELENRDMEEFFKNYNLESLIEVLTCYENPNNPSCIDLILTSSQRSFQSPCAKETGLSDFHRMTVTFMKASLRKLKSKVIITETKVLHKHTPRKSKFVRGNHSPFMNRELSKVIMTRTKLRNKLFKEKLKKTEGIVIYNEITVLYS